MTTRKVVTTTRVEQILHGETARLTAITVNDRAATREAIIQKVREQGHGFVERSEWHAKAPKHPLEQDWDYSMIALHHAGRSYSCGYGADQMIETQESHQRKKFDDIGYHFGIDCSGNVYEGRDVRTKASGVARFNTGVISIVLLNNFTTDEEGGDLVAWGRGVLSFLGVSITNQIPPPQVDATLSLVRALQSFFVIKRLGGHKEFPGQTSDGKICPGNIAMTLVKSIRAKTNLLHPPKS